MTPLVLSSTIRGINSARSSRPMAVPSISLACKTDRPCFANHHHLDLSRILQLALDPAGDLFRQFPGPDIIHGLRKHHNSYLSSRLDGKAFLDTRESGSDFFQFGQPFHVRLEGLP